MALYTCDQRLFLNAAKDALVEEHSLEAAFLFCSPGDEIPLEEAQRFGLVSGRSRSTAPSTEETKSTDKTSTLPKVAAKFANLNAKDAIAHVGTLTGDKLDAYEAHEQGRSGEVDGRKVSPRTTVLDAVTARRAQLEAEGK